METYDSLDFERHIYRQSFSCYNWLTNEQLEEHCPLDNGRHDCTPISTGFATSQLDRLPVELVIEILLLLDIPSLTRFRRLNRRAMQLVNSIRQYAAIIQHCPYIIRVIISIQADAFDCATLYRTLCTTRCSTCNRFGDRLYLIVCRRVCYFCFTNRPEYFTIKSEEVYELFISNAKPQYDRTKFFTLAKPPSILCLSGPYPDGDWRRESYRWRFRLYDRQAVVQSLVGSGLELADDTTGESHKFKYKAAITAPVLLNGGQQVEYGFKCRGCMNEGDEKTMHYKIRYTTEEFPEHIARYGRIVERDSDYPGLFVHVKSASYKGPVS